MYINNMAHKNCFPLMFFPFMFFSLQSSNRSHARAKCFNTLDAYCRLIALLVRHSGDASNSVTKINLLTRVRMSRVNRIVKSVSEVNTDFLIAEACDQFPYQK